VRNISEESRAGVGLSDSGLHLVRDDEESEQPDNDKPTRTTSIAMVVPASALFGSH